MPTSGGGKKRGGRGKSLGGGEEEKDVDEIWWWMMMRLLYTFLHEGILGAQGWHSEKTLTFAFALCILAFKHTSFWDLALKLCDFRRKIKIQKEWKSEWKNKINQQENIREISRERMIKQIQLIRGGLKNNKKWNHKKNQKTKMQLWFEIDVTASFKFSMLLCCPFNYFRCLSGFLWNLKCAPLYSLAALPDSISPDSIRILKKNLSWTVSGILMMQSSNTFGKAWKFSI